MTAGGESGGTAVPLSDIDDIVEELLDELLEVEVSPAGIGSTVLVRVKYTVLSVTVNVWVLTDNLVWLTTREMVVVTIQSARDTVLVTGPVLYTVDVIVVYIVDLPPDTWMVVGLTVAFMPCPPAPPELLGEMLVLVVVEVLLGGSVL